MEDIEKEPLADCQINATNHYFYSTMTFALRFMLHLVDDIIKRNVSLNLSLSIVPIYVEAGLIHSL